MNRSQSGRRTATRPSGDDECVRPAARRDRVAAVRVSQLDVAQTSQSCSSSVTELAEGAGSDTTDPRSAGELATLAPVRVSVGDIELHVREEGAGRPLVLLHGGPGLDGSVFFPQIAALAADGVRLLAIDHRANGRSDDGDPDALDGAADGRQTSRP